MIEKQEEGKRPVGSVEGTLILLCLYSFALLEF